MKHNKKTHQLGFSLIELSIVILVIGILIIGITQGSRIILEAKLKSARSLTASSPVASIGSIVMWLESTSEKSFISGEAVNKAIGAVGTISVWNDINPHTSSPNNATQSTTNNKPRYIASGINGLPVINFDGSNDFMNYDGSSLANNNYAVFVVEQRRGYKNTLNLFIAGNSGGQDQMFHVGYRDDTNLTFGQFNNDINYPIAGYTSPIPRVHSFIFQLGIAKSAYLNGVQQFYNSSSSAKRGLISNQNATLGNIQNWGPGFLYGDLGEIIMFNKAITNNDRINIENYLKTKWGIK